MQHGAINRLEQVKDSILNGGLVFGCIAGFLTYLTSLTRWITAGFEVSFLTDLVILLIILGLTIKRKQLTTAFKSYVIIFAIIGIVSVDIYEIGVLSANKVLLVLIPFFSFISLTPKRTVYVSSLAIIVVTALAVLHIVGFLNVDMNQNLGLTAWLINLAVISIVAFLMVVMLKQFNKAHESMITELKEQNQKLKEHEGVLEQYKNQLEELVEKRTAKLKNANANLRRKKVEVEEALSKLSRAQDELVKSEKLASLGMISSGIAHEINNPLTYIKGGIHGLETHIAETYGKDDLNEVRPMLDMANEGIDRAANIVRSMNQYNRNISNEQCNIPVIINNCIQILALGNSEGISVSTSFPPDFPEVSGNNGELHQVFMNLLTNALDAIEGSGEIMIHGELLPKAVLIQVSDNGKGMSPNVLKRIGEPFFTTKDVGEGTGLGLYIVSKILRDHQGSIKHFSEEDKGTDAIIKLPTAISFPEKINDSA